MKNIKLITLLSTFEDADEVKSIKILNENTVQVDRYVYLVLTKEEADEMHYRIIANRVQYHGYNKFALKDAQYFEEQDAKYGNYFTCRDISNYIINKYGRCYILAPGGLEMETDNGYFIYSI